MQIVEVRLHTSNLSRQQNFYTENLGLSLVDASSKSFTVQVGTSRLTFQQVPEESLICYHFAINIPHNQIREALAWIKKRCKLIYVQDKAKTFFEDWNAHAFYFFDAAGNILECIARHDLKNASAEVFSSNSFICISEIGLPVEKVNPVIDRLIPALKVPIYKNNSETFAALGDENGLLIFVSKNRGFNTLGKRHKTTISPIEISITDSDEQTVSLQHTPYIIRTVLP